MVRIRTDWSTRLVAALLAVAVVMVHVADQGGLTDFTDPDWLGWCYRIIEVAGACVAVAIFVMGDLPIVWFSAVAVAAGPFAGYLLSRTVGLPQDADDKGNWSDPVGTLSLLLEAALVVLALTVVATRPSRVAPGRPRPSARPRPTPRRSASAREIPTKRVTRVEPQPAADAK